MMLTSTASQQVLYLFSDGWFTDFMTGLDTTMNYMMRFFFFTCPAVCSHAQNGPFHFHLVFASLRSSVHVSNLHHHYCGHTFSAAFIKKSLPAPCFVFCSVTLWPGAHCHMNYLLGCLCRRHIYSNKKPGNGFHSFAYIAMTLLWSRDNVHNTGPLLDEARREYISDFMGPDWQNRKVLHKCDLWRDPSHPTGRTVRAHAWMHVHMTTSSSGISSRAL